MFRRNKIIFVIVLVLLIIVTWFLREREGERLEIKLNGQVFQVEVADDAKERYQGLSGREQLARDEGMLFIFDDYVVRSFIMREMNFPLDIIWMRDDEIVGCEENVSIYNEAGEYTIVTSPEPVNQVVEINTGWCGKRI